MNENDYALNIIGAATTVFKATKGWFTGISINTPVANATVTIYDNNVGSGIKLGTITFPATLVSGPSYIQAGYNTKNGLTIVTTGAGLDITIIGH